MLCDTCRYSDSNGYCGQGRTLTGAHYDECSTYKYGEKAEALPSLPGWLSLIINSERGTPQLSLYIRRERYVL
jgi:hypothetical protein